MAILFHCLAESLSRNKKNPTNDQFCTIVLSICIYMYLHNSKAKTKLITSVFFENVGK